MLTVHRVIYVMDWWIARMAYEPLIGNYSTCSITLFTSVMCESRHLESQSEPAPCPLNQNLNFLESKSKKSMQSKSESSLTLLIKCFESESGFGFWCPININSCTLNFIFLQPKGICTMTLEESCRLLCRDWERCPLDSFGTGDFIGVLPQGSLVAGSLVDSYTEIGRGVLWTPLKPVTL